MEATSSSLLIRLQDSKDQQAWSQFVELYTPLMFYWARRTGLNSDDAADLVQDVLTLLVRKLPELRYERDKSFRGWLRTITLNKWRELYRRRSLPMVEAGESELTMIPDMVDSNEFWNVQFKQELVSRAIQMMESEFSPKTWIACQEFVFGDSTAEQVAAKHNLSVWTVYSAKAKLLKKLRERLEGMLD